MIGMMQQVAKPNERLQIDPWVSRDDLHIWRHRGRNNRLVLCFSGIGGRSSEVPTYEFARIATNDGRNSVLFISDPKRSWMNGEGLIEEMVSRAQDFGQDVGAEETVSLGHSMGGFAAIVISGFMPIKSAVALAPQYSVHPDIAGDDRRWMYHRKHIIHHRIGSVADHMVPDTKYHVFHGLQRVEKAQRDRFPVRENLFHTIIPGLAHQVPQKLKEKGLLEPVVRAALANRARKVRLLLQEMNARRRTYDDLPLMGPSNSGN